MNVLVLGYENSPVTEIIRSNGDIPIEFSEKITVDFLKEKKVGFIVSFGYRHIIKKDILEYLSDKVINLHISYLPWNRGADPNLWSFLENSPKGVTVHYIDEGVDTGDIIAQKKVEFTEEENTLASTYERLKKEIISLFAEEWPEIKKGTNRRTKQAGNGSLHKLADKAPFTHLLTESWETPVKHLEGKAL